MKTIQLGGQKAAGRVALVSDEDYELLMQYKWRVWEYYRRGRHDGPYAIAHGGPDDDRATIRMHNLVMGSSGIDHIDGYGLNNQRSNLRPATQAQNNGNQRPQAGRSSQYKGVSWDKERQKWYAYININRRMRHIGRFAAEVEAAQAYDAAALAAWGEFARPNFPTA